MYDFSWAISASVFKTIVVILLATPFTLWFLDVVAIKLVSHYDDKQLKTKAVQPAREKTYILNSAYLSQWPICNMSRDNDNRNAKSFAISRLARLAWFLGAPSSQADLPALFSRTLPLPPERSFIYFSKNHTKHINELCGRGTGFLSTEASIWNTQVPFWPLRFWTFEVKSGERRNITTSCIAISWCRPCISRHFLTHYIIVSFSDCGFVDKCSYLSSIMMGLGDIKINELCDLVL
jgi:hypothetical protein